ncbi:sugar kinase [Subtercola sp. Z020]|uniref:sugar kinase n=1 Tax=Subtercola sp. Z020 TaxID=2080582 RepID=UPI001E55B345|nr:sugar kinase [Subtercola sp. Z020]
MSDGNGGETVDVTGAVLTVGETMALFGADRAGATSRGDSYRLSFGGAESNVATGLARLGTRAAWLGRLGDDDFGRMIARELRAEGVLDASIVDPGAATGTMMKHRRTNHRQSVHYYRANSAGSRLDPRDIPPAALSSARHLHLTGITPALSATARATVESIAAAPDRAGLSIDVNYRANLWSATDARECLAPLFAHADLVFAGLDEAHLVLGRDDLPADDAVRALVDLGAGEAVIKLGAAGAVALVAGGDPVHSPAIAIDVVDSVGAGDAFVAGYLAERLAGLTVEQSLVTANACGAFACLSAGDWEGYPTRSELRLLADTEAVTR